jgi:hypothetical protein
MKALSENLEVLIATAEDLIRKPAYSLPSSLPAGFSELAAEIRHADNQPCDGIRATRAGVAMCIAIEGFFAEQAGDHHWQMVIGTMLPLVRRAAWQAMKNERGIAEESAR